MKQNSIVCHKETSVTYSQISHKRLQSISSKICLSVNYLRFAVIHVISPSISIHSQDYSKHRPIMNYMKFLLTVSFTAILGVCPSCVSEKLGINKKGVNQK